MRFRAGTAFGAVVLGAGVLAAGVFSGGCARTRPCLVIPMQLEMARSERDQVLDLLNQKRAEVDRAQQNVDLSKQRADQMEQELKELRENLSEIESGDSGEGGSQ